MAGAAWQKVNIWSFSISFDVNIYYVHKNCHGKMHIDVFVYFNFRLSNFKYWLICVLKKHQLCLSMRIILLAIYTIFSFVLTTSSIGGFEDHMGEIGKFWSW